MRNQRGFLLNPFRFGGGGADPDYASVVFGTNNQGANAGTSFTDFSSSPATLTANGNAQTSTAQYIFGTSSAYFDGSGDYVDRGAEINISPATSWTQEMWLRPDEASYTGGISSLRGFILLLNSGGDNRVVTTQYYSAAAASRRPTGGAQNNGSQLQTTGFDFSANTWYFIQMVSDAGANTFKVYIGSTPGGTGTEYLSTTAKGVYFRYYGAGGTPGLDYFKGYMGPIRLTSGVARANAIPSGLFPTS